MSFSTEVKEQLTRVSNNKSCCRQMEFLAFLRMSGNMQIGTGGAIGIAATTANSTIVRHYFKIAKEVWDLPAEVLVSKNTKLKKNNLFTLQLPPGGNTGKLLEAFAMIPDGNPWTAGEVIGNITELDRIFTGECCYRAYLRGCFLGNGFISHPKKSYHLEMVCQNSLHAQFIIMLMEFYGLQAKINERKGYQVVYLKESEQISDFLKVVGAYSALLELENIKIYKEQTNMVNRKVNCDAANADKIVETAMRQTEAIRKIAATIGFDKLPKGLREVAALRLELPETSLKELGEMMEPPLSKSGINHRLRKLEKIAEDL